MTEQNTKVTYKAVSDFKSLSRDIDGLLAKIELLKQAEKDLNKEQGKRPRSGSSSDRGSAASIKAQEASQKSLSDKAIKDLRLQAAVETRTEKAKSLAQARRHKRELLNLKEREIALGKEVRAEKAKTSAQTRRNRRADQATKEELKASDLKIRREAEAAARDKKITDASVARNIAKKKAANQAEIKAELAANDARLKDNAEADKQRRLEETAHVKRLELAKNENARERIRQDRNAARVQEAADKRTAQDLERKLALARLTLGQKNTEVSDANLVTRDKLKTRNVGQVKVDFDADKDSNYYAAMARAREQELKMIERSVREIDQEFESRGRLFNLLRKIPSAASQAGGSTSSSFRNTNRSIKESNSLLGNFQRNLDKLGRWRPRLIPPFIALIPIIGGVLGLMNPLIAGMGALSGVVLGLAGNIGSLGGAAIGAIPALSALLAVGAALKIAFGGVGKALKAAGKPTGGGGGSAPASTGGVPSSSAEPQMEELTQVERIQRAQESYRRSIEDVKDATDNLADAKQAYLDRLKEVAKQINEVRKSEARLAADAQLAQENYWNVMADPGSTKGEKMDALVRMDESKDDLKNAKQEVKTLTKELDDLKKTGMDGDKGVRDATRRVTDAIWAQRDAQIDLANSYKDTGKAASTAATEAVGASEGAVDAFQEAMNELSPSAQLVVQSLLGMKDAWDNVKRSVQERFFAPLVEDIKLLSELFPPLEKMLGNTAGALGDLASKALRQITSPEWLEDLNNLDSITVPMITNLGDGLLSILTAFKDLTVAAGPFVVAMTEGFAEGAKNFETMVAGARESGSLAEWLETVADRMAQWWRIVKNVGKTLFNYSAAAGDFGEWLTDGLENLTKGWLDASEEARKEGSPFKVFLEDSKVILTEMKELFGTFFGWLGSEASDKDNIESFARILDTITNELGPALGRIFDVMQDTGVGESLLDAIVQIIETVATLLENGGAEGIKEFFETVNKLFGGIGDVIDGMDPAVVEGISKSLMTIAALQFFGVFKLLGWLGSIVALGPKLKTVFEKITGVDSKTPKTPTSVTPETRGKNFKTAGVRPPTPEPKPGVWSKIGKGAKGLGKVAKGAGPLGLALSALVGMGVDTVPVVANSLNGNYAKNPTQGTADVAKNQLKWSMPGAGLGAELIDTVLPGTPVDDWMTETSDKFATWAKELPGKIGKSLSRTGGNIWSGLKTIGAWFSDTWDSAVTWVTELPEKIGDLGDNIWSGLETIGDWFSDTWDSAVDWIKDTPNRIAREAGVIWGSLLNFGDWLIETWDAAAVWLRDDLPILIAKLGVNIWSGLVSIGDWLYEAGVNAVTWFQEELPILIAKLGVNIWSGLVSVGTWLYEAGVNAVTWFRDELPGLIANLGVNIWEGLDAVGEWLTDAGTDAVKWFQEDLPKSIADLGLDIWTGLTSIDGWLDKQLIKATVWAGKLPGELAKFFGGLGDNFEEGKESVRPGAGGGGGGAGSMRGMSAGGPMDLSSIGAAKPKSKTSVWDSIFGSPLDWLSGQWAAVPEWFTTKKDEILATVASITDGMKINWEGLGTAYNEVYSTVVVPVIDGIRGKMSELGTFFGTVRTQLIDPALRGVGTTFQWLQNSVVAPVWSGIKGTISRTWESGIRPVLETLGRYVRTEPEAAFKAAASGIGRAWDTVEELAKKPVRFVVDVVLGGLRSALNSIEGVNIPPIKLPAGFHDGGYTGNADARKAVGVVHGDEHVIRATSRRRIETKNPGLLDHMNTYGEVPGYRKGGLVNPLPAGSYNVSQPWHGGHNGIDLAAPEGTPVFATADGQVQLAGQVPMGGNEVYIQHENGLGTRYSHLSRFASRAGQDVKEGQRIGYVGSTGNSTGPHLHYMVHNPGRGPNSYYPNENPAGYMNGNTKDLGEAWNPLTGLMDMVKTKFSEKFPGGGMWADAAKGLATTAVKNIIPFYSDKIGKDQGGTAKLYDKGGVIPHGGMGINLSGKPEAVFTNEEWGNLNKIQGLLGSAFSGASASNFSTGNFSLSGVQARPNNASLETDNRIVIENMTVNNPIGETTDESLANTIRDLTYIRG